ncbi:MAG: hypothetical protein NZT92_11455 [Abditibacteriales bacterium]|nr:hypothetical protein [Abditibacteriales bacterium]MDW8365879.1 hypothetical protein [Abditibacteriales bacterium]
MTEVADVLSCVLPALAMGLGWGIRGQFGHQSGAMVPGAMVGLALALTGAREMSPAEAVRLGAVGALACSVGGLMTYGQTLGLVHGIPRSPTYWWGLLGTTVKGSVWIGLTGAFLGMAGGGVEYRLFELLLLVVGLAILTAAGIRLVNRPHDPPRALPKIYFSKASDPKPRPEYWGGLWFALLGLLAYLAFVRSDRFAVGLSLFGIVGGGIGFSVGEMLQAWGIHARPFGEKAQRWMDWWKVMEVTFGAVAGLSLGLGWRLLEPGAESMLAQKPALPMAWEAAMIAVWMLWLAPAEGGWQAGRNLWRAPFAVLLLPFIGVFFGAVTPAFVLLPMLTWVSGDNVVAQWSRHENLVSPVVAWCGLAALTALTGWLAWRWAVVPVEASAWLVATAWIQTALTVLFVLGRRAVIYPDKPGVLNRLAALGAGLTVEVIFVIMAVLLTAFLTIR